MLEAIILSARLAGTDVIYLSILAGLVQFRPLHLLVHMFAGIAYII